MYPPIEPYDSGHLDVSAGHFGGSMGEQFTAAIDAMAGQLHSA